MSVENHPSAFGRQESAVSPVKKSRRNRQAEADKAATRVEAALILPGNFGQNNGSMFIEGADPRNAPGLHLVVIDSDGPLLRSKFSLKNSTKKTHLRRWLDSGRLLTMQLRRNLKEEEEIQEKQNETNGSPHYHRHRKLFGAGGDPEAGRRAVRASEAEIEKVIKDKDIVFLWVGGGGGTGTAVAEKVAEIAKANGIPLLALLTTPFDREGSKIAIADELRVYLRARCKVLVAKNANLPAEARTQKLSKVYRDINQEFIPIFRMFKEFTQVTGTSNLDLEDVLTFFERGTDFYAGSYDHHLEGDRNKDELPIVDVDAAVDKIMNHTYQDHDIKGRAMIGCFHGPWMELYQDQIIRKLQERIGKDSNMYVKFQSVEAEDEMWVSTWICGEFINAAKPEETEEKKELEPISFVKPAEQPPALVSLWCYVNKELMELKVPADLKQRWEAECSRQPWLFPRLEGLQKEFLHYGPKPDITRDKVECV